MPTAPLFSLAAWYSSERRFHPSLDVGRWMLGVGCSAFLFFAGGLATVRAEDGWPEGYVLTDNSPNGRYGVLLPSRLVADALEDADLKNALVDLKTHRHLANIRNAHYFPGQNHHDLHVTWAADSKWCVVTYDGRYGFDAITFVEIRDGKCTQTDLGQHIKKALDAAIARQGHGEDMGGSGTAYLRSGARGQLLVRAYAFTNPKSLEGQPDYRSLFQGTFDPATGKWTRSESRPIQNWDPFETAYNTYLDETLTFPKEADRLAWYDKRLNQVYEAVHIVLPAERFAAVKKQQIAWLKQLEALDSIAAKCQFMGARIQELRQLMW
ncbi:MAG: hypothetical protein ABJF10_28915 [Chthoniobacter sp.]|uniref:hypothetical protein n=1 Tax=Chthoniobacter sp. TaxID=2510640 RepID=UPI0032A4E3BD